MYRREHSVGNLRTRAAPAYTAFTGEKRRRTGDTVNWVATKWRRLVGGAVERRIYPRYNIELGVIATLGTREYPGLTCDLSVSGMGAYLYGCELKVGDEVILRYQLPDGSPVKTTRAVVRHRTGSRYGLEFLKRR